jgi:ribonuclease HI
VTIYTDGACSGNPGPGGWGAILRFGRTSGTQGRRGRDHQQPHGADGRDRSAERFEAALRRRSLHRQHLCAQRHQRVDVRLEAEELEDRPNKPVKNADLWQALDAARDRHDVTWHWVKGHAGHPDNERADELARGGMEPFKKNS